MKPVYFLKTMSYLMICAQFSQRQDGDGDADIIVTGGFFVATFHFRAGIYLFLIMLGF